MHTQETVLAEVAYRHQRARDSWRTSRRRARRGGRQETREVQPDLAGATLRSVFGGLFGLLGYRVRAWISADANSRRPVMAITLQLTPAEEDALSELARAEGISRHQATVRAIRQAASRTRR